MKGRNGVLFLLLQNKINHFYSKLLSRVNVVTIDLVTRIAWIQQKVLRQLNGGTRKK